MTSLRSKAISLAVTAWACGLSHGELIHHWTFEGDLADSGPGANPLVLQSNASLAADTSVLGDGALLLDAASAPLNGGAITENPVNWSAFANGDTRTIAMWVKLTPGQESNATFLGAGVNANSQRFDVKVNNNNFRVEIQGTGQTTGEAMDTDTWRHIAVVVPNADSGMQDMLFYIDGQSVTNASTSSLAVNTATAVVRLGDSVNTAADRDTNGYIDDVRIYDTALSAGEITSLYNSARLARRFAADDTEIVIGTGPVALDWALGGFTSLDSLTLTNDQDATVIDAAALTTDGIGSTTVDPAVTTTYTLTASADGGALTDVRQLTIIVKTTPDLLTFTASPQLVYGIGAPVLTWTTSAAGRLEISDGTNTLATYTAGADGQLFLDAGSFTAPAITTATTYTLTGWLDEAGTGDSTTIEVAVDLQPAPDITLHPSPPFTSSGDPVTLSWNATVISNEIVAGDFDGFPIDPSDPIGDSTQDFDALLSPGTTYFLEFTDGNIAGSVTEILSWSGSELTVANNYSEDTSWVSYRITTLAGTDTIVINDGISDIATITDPAEILSGSLTLDPGPTSTTTYTATASITGAAAVGTDSRSVTVGGPDATYAGIVFADGPVGYYRFEENAGSTVIYDSSGNGNHSTSIIGDLTTGVSGPLGICARFNGSETVTTGVTLNPQDPDGDDLAADDDPDDSEGWTLEALFRSDIGATNFDTQHIWSNQDGSGTGRSMLYLRDSGTLTSFAGGTTSPKTDIPFYAQKPAGAEDWYHGVMTCTGNPDGSYTLRVYRDGVLEAEQIVQTGAGAPVAPEFADGAWVIGSHKNRQAGVFWEGLLDECAIYDRALNDAEVAEHFDAFLAQSSGILEFSGTPRVVDGGTGELTVKIGGAGPGGTIDNGAGAVAAGAVSTLPIMPGADTTYTLDVGGETATFEVILIDPFFITDFVSDGINPPALTVEGLTEGINYQLFVSDDLALWTASGGRVVADGTGTAVFTDATAFDPVTRPSRFYQIRDVDPVAAP